VLSGDRVALLTKCENARKKVDKVPCNLYMMEEFEERGRDILNDACDCCVPIRNHIRKPSTFSFLIYF
jgi:hypothetical protein